MPQPLVIIPTYNERDNIRRLLREVFQTTPGAEVLIVDDNSPDGTGELADALCKTDQRIHVLHRKCKEGLGRAYLAGFAWALERTFDPICTMDADHSHSPAALPALIKATEEGADIAIGSRYVPGGSVVGWPRHRYLLSWTANHLTRLLLGLRPADVTAGYKCYRRSFFADLDLRHVVSPGYAFQVEMLAHAHDQKLRLQEIPITFHDRTVGQSKVSRHELFGSAHSLMTLAANRPAIRQFRRFVLIGTINVLIDLAITNIFVLGFHWQPLAAGYVGIGAGLILSFVFNRRWAFVSNNPAILHELGRFLLVNGAGAVINTISYTLFISHFHLWYNWAKLAALLGSGLWNFFGTKYWVFRSISS